VDGFIQLVLARLSSLAIGKTDLNALWERLMAERHDLRRSSHRRLEALMGFDVDFAPAALIAGLQEDTATAGRGAVDEMAAAAKGLARVAIKDAMDGPAHPISAFERLPLATEWASFVVRRATCLGNAQD